MRSLFPWPEVQAGEFQRYTKHMAIIDRRPERGHTYLIKLVWCHTEPEDRIIVTVRKFDVAPVGLVPNMDAIAQRFQDLGFQ